MHVNLSCGMIKKQTGPQIQIIINLVVIRLNKKKIDKLDAEICEDYLCQRFEGKFFHKLHIYNYCSIRDQLISHVEYLVISIVKPGWYILLTFNYSNIKTDCLVYRTKIFSSDTSSSMIPINIFFCFF